MLARRTRDNHQPFGVEETVCYITKEKSDLESCVCT